MTREEAIQILESGTKFPDLPHSSDDLDEACRMAVAALRAQQKVKGVEIDQFKKLDRNRWEGCSMCTAEHNPEDWGKGGAHDFRIKEDGLYYFDAQFGWEGMDIKFCPNCGRPLTDKAWAELERRINGGTTDI